MKGILKITGGIPLKGNVKISGSKFTVIPIIVSSLLSRGQVHLKNVPRIRDVEVLISSLYALGVFLSFRRDELFIDSRTLNDREIPDYLIKQMRGTFLFLPVLLVARGFASIAVPGGCRIGKRPFNEHINVLKSFGAKVSFDKGRFIASIDKIKPVEIILNGQYPSPGATKSFIIMALGAKGTSIVNNASVLPEIVGFISFLNKLGAEIKIEGTTIIIEGNYNLNDGEFVIPSDRIECLSWIIACAITKGIIVVENGAFCFLECKKELSVLSDMGLGISKSGESILINGKVNLNGAKVITGAYPEFNTDVHPIFVPLLMISKTQSELIENIFEDRFRYLQELQNMGGDFSLDGNKIIIRPVFSLKGTVVHGFDIRATASLVIAALGAEGLTTILNAGYLERAYEDFEIKAISLGAKIEKIAE